MSTRSTTTDPVTKHRREVRWQIVLPVVLPFFALIVFAVLLAVGVATDALVSKQIAVIMGIVGTAFITLPLSILCLITYGLVALGAVGAGKLHQLTTKPLRSVRGLTTQIAIKTDELAPKVARPAAGLNVRFTRWEQRLRQLQAPTEAVDTTPDRPSDRRANSTD